MNAIDNSETYLSEIYNVGLTEANLTKIDLCENIKKVFPDFNYFCAEFATDPDQRDYLVSNSKLEGTGWKPSVNLFDGILELKHGLQSVKKMGHSNI